MEQCERKNDGFSLNENKLLLLDKAELVKKCIEQGLALGKAQRELEIYLDLLTKSSTELERMRSKIPVISHSEYNKDWSWVNKIVFVLKKVGRPLLSGEIIDFITPHEPVLQYSHHRAQAFSANLTKAVRYDRVKTFKLKGARGYYYVLPAWLDRDGQLIKEYEDKIVFN